MPPQQRLSLIRLMEKLAKNPEYAERLGIEIMKENEKTKMIKQEE